MKGKKVFYRYNPQSLSYERIFPSMMNRIVVVLRHLLSGILIGSGGLFIFIFVFGSPESNALKEENRLLRVKYDLLSRRIDQAFKILEPIQERDDYMYRAVYQADPIAPSIRTSGIGSIGRYQELQNISNPDLVIQTAQKMDVLEKQLYVQSNSLDEVLEMVRSQKDRLHHMPSIVPVSTKDWKKIASGFGSRIHPIYGIRKLHTGMDFSADIGTPVYATADGVVTVAKDIRGGYGKHVDIDHGYNYVTRYAHLHNIKVRRGQKVKRGEIIGEVGNTGLSTGPHLHYEVRLKDIPQNPAYYYHGDLSPDEFDEVIQISASRGNIMD